jgi:outer membrane protein assembly factor BamB
LTAGENLVLVAMSNFGAKALSLADGSMLWESNDYDAPDIPSPVLGNGLAFILSNNGTLTCVAAATGDVKWSHEFDGTFNSSPLIINDLLLLTDLDGKSYVIKAAAKFETVATAQLGEACYATPAVIDSRLYFRGNEYLYCIGGTAP